MSRFCEKCESGNLGMVMVAVGYWRKVCLDCGSPGPFVPRFLLADSANSHSETRP